jgi:ferredoxin
MCSITYRGQQLSAPQGSKLRTAMLLSGVSPYNGKAQLINCRGLGTCGTCAVEIK